MLKRIQEGYRLLSYEGYGFGSLPTYTATSGESDLIVVRRLHGHAQLSTTDFWSALSLLGLAGLGGGSWALHAGIEFNTFWSAFNPPNYVCSTQVLVGTKKLQSACS